MVLDVDESRIGKERERPENGVTRAEAKVKKSPTYVLFFCLSTLHCKVIGD